MKLNNLERVVLAKFLTSLGRDDDYVLEALDNVGAQQRRESRAGFMTDLHISKYLEVDDNLSTYKWGKVGAIINETIDTGYLLYIDNGLLTCIEGYVFDEEWPVDIVKIDSYDLNEL